jgi:YD repeat-containing protein
MTAVIDALNQRYEFQYDPLGRTLSQTKAGLTMSYSHNAVGSRISRTDYKGVTTNYQYDALHRLRNIIYPNASENISFTYDALSRLNTATNYAGVVDFNYTKRNQVSQVLDVHGRKINYTYDRAGNPNLMSLDDVQQIDYAFDKVNRLQLIKNLEDNTVVDYNYDAANRLTRKILPNGITTVYQYDGMSRLTRLRDFKTNPDTTQTNLYNRQYSYDVASNISQIKIGNQTKNYNYDLIDRLTQVTASNAQQNESYGYDGVGNRLISHLSTTYQYDAFNKLTQSQQASFVYDNNGNMTSKTDASGTTQYVWDYENRLRQIMKPDTATVSYKYDALGRRSEQIYGNGFSTKFELSQTLFFVVKSKNTKLGYFYWILREN